MKKINRGFTLIELLVVIAIIGILSAIVLASLSTARAKANDSKVQGQLSSMRAAAEIYYGNNNNAYAGANCTAGMFNDDTSGMKGLYTSTNNTSSNVICAASNTAWYVQANLPSNGNTKFCVDSTGFSGSIGNNSANSSALKCQ